METSRHKIRELGMTCIYQCLLLNGDIKNIVFENTRNNNIDPFLHVITIKAIENKDSYIERINEVIAQDWSFDRLGFVERSILLLACSELDYETNSKAVVLDEAITLTKKYCDDEAFKLINAILDNV